MLKRILLLAVLLVSLGSSMSLATNHWYYVGTQGGISYYIDNDTVQKDDKSAYVWTKMIDSRGREVWGHVLISRYGKTFTVTEVRGPAGSRKADQYTKIQPIVPNSPIEKIVDLIW